MRLFLTFLASAWIASVSSVWAIEDLPLRELLEPAQLVAPEEKEEDSDETADLAREADVAEDAAEEEVAPASEGGRQSMREPVEENPAVPPLLVGTTEPRGERASVYVVEISGPIDRTNLFILRRALKEAIRNDIEMVVLDMDTPGGRVDYTLEMMEMLARFDGVTATYVNNDAISAGSFIAAATDEIYFSPRGRIGASAVVMGGGGEVPETARLKIESYLQAAVRSLTEDFRYRGDVIRAMMDADFELKVDGFVIKPAGELLTLTGREAMQEFGEPPLPLLGSGIYSSIEQLLEARWGADRFEIRAFEMTYSERLAKWMSTFAPALLGIGMLLLFIEFKTPGFGIFGGLGIALLGVFFISNYIAGLAGNEVMVIFLIGIVLILVELIFFPGFVIFAVSGALMVFGSLLWAMVDYWPGDNFQFTLDLLLEPMINMILAVALATFGAIFIARFLPGSWVLNRMVLSADLGQGSGVGGGTAASGDTAVRTPIEGDTGVATCDLMPGGEVEIDGRRHPVVAETGSISRGATVRIIGKRSYDFVVEEVKDQ